MHAYTSNEILIALFLTAGLGACGGPQRAGTSETSVQATTPRQESAPAATAEGASQSTSGGGTQKTTPPTPGRESAPANQFVLREDAQARDAQGAKPSKIKPTRTEAAMKFFVVDKDKGPVPGIVIALTGADGSKHYTEETDAQGYAEVLVPVGQKYELVYLSLGRQDIAATVPVTNEPNQNVKLTLRYKRHVAPTPPAGGSAAANRFILKGVNFDTGKASLRPESFARLDTIVEYMAHKPRSRIEISGHTDNQGNPKANQALSEKRAKAVREYLISKGVEGGRIEAVGYGDQRPIDGNETESGRQENRRIEATEL